MKIAILQFDSRLRQKGPNFSLAESLLMREEHQGRLHDLDLLVLPELAFTGYNYKSLADIAPFLEPTADGPSTRWAQRTAMRLGCTVAVGYPEAAEEGNYNTIVDDKIVAGENAMAYNSLVFVNHLGDVVGHYRKSFLYYTDESWATEGSGFFSGVLPMGSRGKQVKAVAGICMDINPYKFEAPWTAYEFANHARDTKAKVVIVSMAWLTRLTGEETRANPDQPDMDTLSYWVERFRPLLGPNGSQEEVILICANRTGEEGSADKIPEVRYAGSSAVMGLRRGDINDSAGVRLWDVMGRAQDGLMLVDTSSPPKYGFQKKAAEEDFDATTAVQPQRPTFETEPQSSGI